jgi:hypothetical protein
MNNTETNTEVTGQIDLLTGEAIVVEETVTLETVVDQVVGDVENVTGYQIMKWINEIFKVTGTEKTVPTQMGYIYGSKGMISKRTKGMKGSEIRYTNEEARTFITKYTTKHVDL